MNVGGYVPGDTFTKAVFKNPGHDDTWISLRLVGVRANRAAIGANIKLTMADAGEANPIR